MLVPSIFGESLFDDFMDFPFEREFFRRTPAYGKTEKNIMKTDVKETDNAYELDIDLPGYKKEEVTAKIGEWLSDHQRYQRCKTMMSRTKKANTSAGSVIQEP